MKRYKQKFCSILSIPVLLLVFSSCADRVESEPSEKKEVQEKRSVVGRVASIPANRTFVLIQAYGTWTVPSGSILTTQGPNGRSANLRVSGEKLGQYAAADIQSGTLEVGDGVYSIVVPVEDDSVSPTSDSAQESETSPVLLPSETELLEDQPIIPTSSPQGASE
ncbi:hypothetical protein [Luteolibacter sp. AS25]|uniref:hypothetical protein n=1 Tax=Luteolibacter sp. AS25 TaxID=3135776 RepID=UPI00398B5424